MRVIVYYYSFTEQCQHVAEHVRAAFPAGYSVTLARIIPDDPKFQLTVPLKPFWRRFLGTIWPTQRGHVIPVHLQLDGADGDFELVVVGGPTWWSSPSVPLRSFLESEDAKARLRDKAVALFAGCRGVYEPNLDAMAKLVGELGGRVVARQFFQFAGSTFRSFLSFFSYVMSGVRRDRWLGFALTPYGFSEETLARSTGLVQQLIAAGAKAEVGAKAGQP
jgi:hypothetical protein